MAAQQVSHYLPDVIQTAANDLADSFMAPRKAGPQCVGDRLLGTATLHYVQHRVSSCFTQNLISDIETVPSVRTDFDFLDIFGVQTLPVCGFGINQPSHTRCHAFTRTAYMYAVCDDDSSGALPPK